MLHPVENPCKSHLLCDFRCTVQECSGTLTWPLSWCWPLKMTDCQSSRCGTSVLPHHPLKSLRTTQGESLTVCTSFSFNFFSHLVEFTVCSLCMVFSYRGILSISWSQADSELLLSSAKDNRILCWNPNTGEVYHINCCFFVIPEFYLASFLLLDFNTMGSHSRVISLILGHLRASNNKPVVFRCPVVPQESSPAFSCLI